MSISPEDVLATLRSVRYPGFSRDIVSFGIVKDVTVAGDEIALRLDLGPGSRVDPADLERSVREALARLPGASRVAVQVTQAGEGGAARQADAGAILDSDLIPHVRHAVAVASGKGGVGKSTIAVNLAVALARRGARVGLLDADIYGPSIPLMMGVDAAPALDETGRRITPFERWGVRFMSLGFLVEKGSAVIWRGPMVMKALEQLLRDVDWGALDILVVDLPPGTGDAQLTLSQKVRLAGAVIVTTPQDVALADAVKGVAMFRKVGVPVLGIVENMSYFECPHCGGRSEIFGHGGGRSEAERLAVPFLGEIALDPAIRDGGDRGEPLVVASPESPRTVAILGVADRILSALEVSPEAEGRTGARGGLLSWLRPKPENPETR